MKTQIEYRVRPVTRHIVTRYESQTTDDGAIGSGGQSTQHGEFDSFDTAYAVGYALAQAEHARLGWPPGDGRICYPHHEAAAPVSYAAMEAGDFLQALGDDAQKWSDAFAEQYPEIDRGVMIGWFANAIEHSSDVRRGRLVQSDEAWADFNEQIAALRRFLRNAPADRRERVAINA
jgi:hypothetical protein